MLHYGLMAKGPSGRIVIEIDPALKGRLYALLAGEGKTLKTWFLEQVSSYIRNAGQLGLFDSRAGKEREPQ